MPNTIEYFSQPATRQDEWVLSQSQGPGYFIEIGAHDGVRHSNTLTLERFFNWTGLLVEPNPRLFKLLQRNRPDCAHSDECIGPRDDFQQSFVIGDAGGSDSFSGLIEHMSDEWYEGHARHKSRIEHMDTTSLRSLLEKNICPTTIDYLSLDVEGAELAILESFFGRPRLHRPGDYRINLLTIEFRYDRLLLDKLEKLLDSEYRLTEVRAFDACFVHKSFGDSHARARAA